MASLRERAISQNTLVCLLQAIQGHETTVELRDEASVFGLIVNVDAFMNTTMKYCTYTDHRGKTMQFDDFYVQGRNIRFVQIPDAVNMMEAIEYQLGSIERRQTQHSQERKKMMALREERRRKREAKSKKT
ncbi:U7 snRNA-associated Sm-like protein LSm10 [Branchiostoma floridae x Branchiostoma japonicum]